MEVLKERLRHMPELLGSIHPTGRAISGTASAASLRW